MKEVSHMEYLKFINEVFKRVDLHSTRYSECTGKVLYEHYWLPSTFDTVAEFKDGVYRISE